MHTDYDKHSNEEATLVPSKATILSDRSNTHAWSCEGSVKVNRACLPTPTNMAGEKRKQRGGANSARDAKRRRYDPKQMYRSGEIRGPGIWFTCDRRKEAKAVVEAYDLLNEVGSVLSAIPHR